MAQNPVQVTITGDASGLLDALNQGTAGLKGFAQEVNGVSSGLMGVVKNLQAPFMALAALVGGGAMLKGAVKETVDWTVQAQKLDRVLGITTEEASAWGVAIQEVHGDAETFLGITAKMTRTLNTNESAFNKLGVATRDGSGHLRAAQEVLLDTFAALDGFREGTDRNVSSTKIFGRSWLEVQKYLRLNHEALEEARDKAARLNLIVGGDSVTATNQFRKSSEDLDLTLKGLKIRLGQELLPVLTQFNSTAAEKGPDAIGILGFALKGLVEIFDGVFSGVKMAGIGLWSFLRGIYDTLVMLLNTAWGFLSGGLPEARKQWAIAKAETEKNWSENQAALDRISTAFANRSQDRWANVAKVAAKAVKPTGGKDGDTEEHAKKENANQEEINRLRAEAVGLLEKETLAQKEAAEIEADRARLNDDLSRLEKERKEGRLTDAQLQARGLEAVDNFEVASVNAHKKATEERARIDRDTQEKAGILEAEGVEAQVRRKIDEFRQINEERRKAGLAALSQEAMDEQIASLRAKDVMKNRDSSRWGPLAGMFSGLDDYIQKARNGFETMRGAVSQVLEGVQGAFAKTFQGILTGQMSFRQGIKALWKDISGAIIGALANIAAQYVTAAIAQKIFSTATATTSATETAAATQQAAAETWAAYAPIPFAGEALAMAQIAVMMASIAASGVAPAAVTAHALGGVIDRPTLALMGEMPRSREVVAPETTFKDWAGNLTRNIVAQERQTMAYHAMGASYASAAASAGGIPSGGLHVHLEGSTIMGESVESARIIGRQVKRALDDYNRRNG